MSGTLAGKRIVNTRAVHQAEALNKLLRARNAVPLDYPCIAIIPPDDSTDLDAALLDLGTGRFDWLIITSSNTVMALATRLQALNLKLSAGSFRTAAVGPATAEAVREHLGLEVDHIPAEYIAEELAASLNLNRHSHVLLPESLIARPTLASLLREQGAEVMVVTAYLTVCGEGGVDLGQKIARRQVDALTFTSSSTVSCFIERLSREEGPIGAALMLCSVCIGPKTAATAREYGFTNVVVPDEYTLDGMLDALAHYFMSIEEQS